MEGSWILAVNTVITSIEFRGKARKLGFEAKGSAEDDGLRPMAKAMPRGTQRGFHPTRSSISAASGNDASNLTPQPSLARPSLFQAAHAADRQ